MGVRGRVTPRKGSEAEKTAVVGFTYDLVWNDTLFLSSSKGLGINIIRQQDVLATGDRFLFGASVNIGEERGRSRSQTQFRSLDIRTGKSAFALVFSEYKLGNWRLWAEGATYFDHNLGNVASFGADYIVPLSPKWSLTLGSGISFGDAANLREVYGIPSNIALQQGIAPFRLGPGPRDASVSAEFEYQADQHWRWTFGTGYNFLLGQAAQSPRTIARSELVLSSGIKYRF